MFRSAFTRRNRERYPAPTTPSQHAEQLALGLSDDAAPSGGISPTRAEPITRARRTDPETSHAAAAKALILAALEKGNGNIYEIGKACGLTHVQVARRLPEMDGLQLAHPTDERREGCRVWAKGPKP
jgi:hypothetical protein